LHDQEIKGRACLYAHFLFPDQNVQDIRWVHGKAGCSAACDGQGFEPLPSD
jgi:hypothetical protein